MQDLYSTIAGIVTKPVVNVQRFNKLGNGFYSVIFASAIDGRQYKAEDFDDVFAGMYDGKLRLVSNTLFRVPTNVEAPLYRAVLEARTESIPFNDAEVKARGLHPIQANVFSDESDSIWKVVGDNDTKRLVQVSEDNYDELLEAKRVRNRVAASYDAVVPINEGDYVHFMNVASGKMDFGFAVVVNGEGRILAKSSGELLDIEESAVLVAADISDIDGSPAKKKMEMLASDSFSATQLIDYMRMLYGSSDMIRDLEKKIRQIGIH